MDKEVMELLKEFRNEVNEQFKAVNEQFKAVNEQFKAVNEQFKAVNEQFKVVNEQFKAVNARLDEHTQILRALEHNSEVNKAEHDRMFNDIAYIKGQVEQIKRDLNRVEEATANNWLDIARLKAVR